MFSSKNFVLKEGTDKIFKYGCWDMDYLYVTSGVPTVCVLLTWLSLLEVSDVAVERFRYT